MHTLVLRSSHARNGKDLALRIHHTLQELKRDFYKKVAIMRNSPVFPWLDDYIEEIVEMMGEDPWAHGIKNNTRVLNKFLDFSYGHGLIRKRPKLEELFVDLDE